jgi:hypothetical protein
MESIVKRLVNGFNKDTSGQLNGMEGALVKNNFMRDISEDDLDEKWSEKYKKSIDCNNPKGFSQKAHCQGRKKKGEYQESTGAASAGGYSAPLFGESDGEITKVEANEVTSSSSVGAYDAPGFEDVNMKGNHHRGSGRSYKETQVPGGSFVEVKSKCKKFPYCNQGIGAIKLHGGKELKEAISKVSKKMNISEDTVREIIAYEYRNLLSK